MVRIVEDFWTNYHEYEEVIISSILHIVRTQFPNKDPQGESEDMNFVITELYRLNIFGKWKEERLTSGKTNPNAQFEKFLYQRIWAILWNEYARRKKRSMRFKRMPNNNEYHKETYQTPDRLYDDEIKIDDIAIEKRDKEAALRHKRAVSQPTIHDVGEINGSCSLAATDDALIHKEMIQNILSVCNNEKERKIIQLRQEGLRMYEIGETLKMTGANVSITLIKIKERLQQKVSC